VGNTVHVKIQPHPDKPGLFTVTPYGPIDSDTYLDFDDKTKSILVPSTKGVVLDLANVDYISSAGLGVLFTMKKFLKQKGSDLVFSNLKPQIKRLFEIVNALPKETVFQSTEEADAYLYKMMNQEKTEE
jgi:anti-sigma B factor antagonist